VEGLGDGSGVVVSVWVVLGLGVGLSVGVKVMLRSVEEKVLALESARVMERLNLLESELRWQMAKAQALESDLARVQEKNSKKAKAMVRALVKENSQKQ